MTQYCRYCAHIISGDGNYCEIRDKFYTDKQICRTNKCRDFEFVSVDSLSGREYKPRNHEKRHNSANLKKKSNFDGDRKMNEKLIESTIETLCAADHVLEKCDSINTDIADLAAYVSVNMSGEDALAIINALTLAWMKVNEAKAKTSAAVRELENKKEGVNNA